MRRLTQFPWGPLGMSMVLSTASFIAIVGFGAPPLTLILVGLAGSTVYMEVESRVRRGSGRY
jgi:hypothetical protein